MDTHTAMNPYHINRDKCVGGCYVSLYTTTDAIEDVTVYTIRLHRAFTALVFTVGKKPFNTYPSVVFTVEGK